MPVALGAILRHHVGIAAVSLMHGGHFGLGRWRKRVAARAE